MVQTDQALRAAMSVYTLSGGLYSEEFRRRGTAKHVDPS